MSKGMSIREYARHRRAAGLRGGSPWGVQKALKAGRIHTDADGKIDPEQADAAWAASTDASRGDGRAGPASASVAVSQPHPAVPPPAPLPAGAPSYATSRAIREAYAARLAKITYEEKAKSLVDAARIQAEAFRRARDARDAVLAVPGRLAAILAAETNPATIEARLTEELRAALEVLARD